MRHGSRAQFTVHGCLWNLQQVTRSKQFGHPGVQQREAAVQEQERTGKLITEDLRMKKWKGKVTREN